MRQIWLTLVFLGLGCQSFTSRQGTSAPTPAEPAVENPLAQSLRDLEKKTVKQAAELLAQRREEEACACLAKFLTSYPDRCEVRLAYADLLFNLKQIAPSRTQYEELLEQSQDLKFDDGRLLRIHGQLADIAQGLNDKYAEHLHRGIGLYLMARNFQKGVGVGGTTFSKESLLSKAQSELTKAHEINPDESRPRWYLYGVFCAQDQKSQADDCLRLAHQLARQSRLTHSERRGIELAMRSLALESRP